MHPRLRRVIQQRRKAIEEGSGIDWATAEHLSFASLLVEGFPVRLSGEDVGRGTFSQRHAVIYDQMTEEKYIPLLHLKPKQASIEVIDSILSEEGVLGFEYGYSLADPNCLTIWEAQFGDFANGAQVYYDQFISSGESKWLRLCGLVNLLPHGYEGQGPEHSSARLERFLQLYAENNIQVVCPSTPASYFHVLRRQLHREFRKPLIVMTPKSLLRHKRCVSTLDELALGSSFHRVLWETPPGEADQAIERVILCSGKVYYDILQGREDKWLDGKVAIIRLEELAPFPERGARGRAAPLRAERAVHLVPGGAAQHGRLVLRGPPDREPDGSGGHRAAAAGLCGQEALGLAGHRIARPARARAASAGRGCADRYDEAYGRLAASGGEPCMSVEIRVPTLGESVSEATIAKWLKKAGDAVAVDEPLVELETDKVSLEVPAPSAGVLARDPGRGRHRRGGGCRDRPDRGRRRQGRGPRQGQGGREGAGPGRGQRPARGGRRSRPGHGAGRGRARARRRRGAAQAGPAARKLAAEKGLDLAAVPATGPKGNVTKGDVVTALAEAALSAAETPVLSEATAPAAAAAPAPAARAGGREERVRMTRLRKRIAERLKEAQNTAAMLTTFNEVDMTATIEMRARYQDSFTKKHGIKLGFMGFFVKAVGRGAQGLPRGQRRDRRRRGGLQAPLRHRRRRQHRPGPGRAGGARRRAALASPTSRRRSPTSASAPATASSPWRT